MVYLYAPLFVQIHKSQSHYLPVESMGGANIRSHGHRNHLNLNAEESWDIFEFQI